MIKKKVAIIIPFHKTTLSPNEKISMDHMMKYLGKFDKFLVLPNSINKIAFVIPKAKIINFPDEYFTSVSKYCELLNTKKFYEKFLNYEYILIHQLDVLVFSRDLVNFCRKNYDFIGAPFFNPLIGKLSYASKNLVSGCNGGFSLRKVSSFLKVIRAAEQLATRSSANPYIRKLWFLLAVLTNKSHKRWLNAFPKDYPFNEDGFWSYEAPKYYSKFKVAPFKEALKFSFERFPKRCFEINNRKLPFGTHAWEKYDPIFWKKYLKD